MADMLNDGNIKVTYVAAIANMAAPTAAELNGGLDLECLITADGLEPSVDEEKVSIAKLCETMNAEAPGRATYGLGLTMVRKDVPAEDVAWTTLLRGTSGYLVFRYGIDADTAYAALQDVQVWPGKFGERRPQKPEANGATTFMSQFYVSATPDMDATVA
ncbi:hypothetical protein DMH01_03295 [Amycolatopsis sp. WAC 04182]|uniref:phage tail tube protein n=1 Tax=Amycolatopsis sp. WAC 04182 TaxID=2203198 RepID=UPI000F7B7CDC|nr:hypothetical protein [Amycolatopsis sp. WAC 04182]RSN65416.1 hypothetical protein DMH01_03295 [Amycolatopsis sp. WAC 04182]